LPRACRGLASRKLRIAVLAGCTAALALVSLAWKAWSFATGHSLTGSFTTWFGPMANLDSFAIGMAVAIITAAADRRRPVRARGRLVLRVVALAILGVAFATRQADAWPGVYFSTLCAAGFGTLVAAATLGTAKDAWGKALSCGPLAWLGTISYSIYLWHEPILLALAGWGGVVRQIPGAFLPDVVAVLVASVLVGWLSYSLIERPTSQLGRVFGRDGRLIAPAASADAEHIEWETFRSGNPF
jgi:peptidoglycan/LPS O-acetylase OafA/YrhL